ncbi:hypothetical protein BDZ94DRAFT_456121 [Collybia nuda]|uniref:Uncharacterized protein n=1 Tax=Collybia nuda TaxID=64659 RepID=A0A9P6CFY8_9AGAR|nr:hypothetical protein BDZ94DRAFT_456121 [Collybia nuda]
MLPANPRSGFRGLPTNPSPRSRSIGRATLEREKKPPSPPSEPSTKVQIAHSRTSYNSIELHLPRKSDDYTSSSRSSLLSRKNLGAAYTTRSSGTTLEDDHQPYSRKQPIEHDERLASLRQSGDSKERPVSIHDKDREQEITSNVGDGSAIWNRVATVASTLTVSVRLSAKPTNVRFD